MSINRLGAFLSINQDMTNTRATETLHCEGEEHAYGEDAGTRALSLSHTCGHTGRARTVLDWVVLR